MLYPLILFQLYAKFRKIVGASFEICCHVVTEWNYNYQFSKSTMLRYGDMISYQASLDKAINTLNTLLENLKEVKKKRSREVKK